LACGSDDSPGGGGGASGTATNEAGKNSGSSGSSSGGSASGSSSHAGTASTSAGTSSGGASGLSPACQKFCDCHQANCSTLAIPGGKSCADFCAAMTEDQLACRQNMCGLVPAQPDNDHCKHSLGIDQCL
jgi:hypothetical protein